MSLKVQTRLMECAREQPVLLGRGAEHSGQADPPLGSAEAGIVRGTAGGWDVFADVCLQHPAPSSELKSAALAALGSCSLTQVTGGRTL